MKNALYWVYLALESESDTAYDELLTLLDCWQACFEKRAATLKEAIQNIGSFAESTGPANRWNDLRDALGEFDPRYEGKGLNANPIGQHLNKLQGRVIDQRRLVRGDRTKTGFPWKVKNVEANIRGGVEGVGNVGNPSRRQIYPTS